MNRSARVLVVLTLFCGSVGVGLAGEAARLTLCCEANNDLAQVLKSCGYRFRRCATPAQAVATAPPRSAVLFLANNYPQTPTEVTEAQFDQAAEKGLRIYIEYPGRLPGCTVGPARKTGWERAVVATDDFGPALPKLRVLAPHECRLVSAAAGNPLLVFAKVAGFDTAVYGLPRETYPLLFEMPEQHLLVATTKLSGFIESRFAPARDWQIVWQLILDRLDPAQSPHRLRWTPAVRPSFGPAEKLPRNHERRAFAAAADWLLEAGLLVSAARKPEIDRALAANQETMPMPPVLQAGDGSFGIQEGYASGILEDGKQLQRLPLRGDCHAESAMVLALQGTLNHHQHSRVVASNLLDFIYFNSGMCQGVRADPKSGAFGLVGWGDISPLWLVANYGDDNASDMLGTILVSACLKTDRWNEPLARAVLANFRTTGKLGFRGDRIDLPELAQNGWKFYRDREVINYSPHFEANLWACDLWAYRQTGFAPLLHKATNAIAMTMRAYPGGWRWQNNIERAHMLLCLAWLVRLEDTPEHRGWLLRMAEDLLKDQQADGGIRERLGQVSGFFRAPKSNEEYGTGESTLMQQDSDAVTDQLYTTGFALLGLHEAVAATGEGKLRRAEDKLAEYLCRIQIRAPKTPWLNGWWFRAFDDRHWEYWASSADVGWGAWSLEAGWGQAWTAATLELRAAKTSVWDMTRPVRISSAFEKWKSVMLE